MIITRLTLTLAVYLWHQNGVRRCLACASLWYEPLRGETGLSASTPWLKFSEIGILRLCTDWVSRHGIQINRVPAGYGLRPARPKKRTHQQSLTASRYALNSPEHLERLGWWGSALPYFLYNMNLYQMVCTCMYVLTIYRSYGDGVTALKSHPTDWRSRGSNVVPLGTRRVAYPLHHSG